MSADGRLVTKMASAAERTASTAKTHRHVAPSPSASPMKMGATAIPMAKNSSRITMARWVPTLTCELTHIPGRLLRNTQPRPTKK